MEPMGIPSIISSLIDRRDGKPPRGLWPTVSARSLWPVSLTIRVRMWQFYEFDQGEFFPVSPPKESSMSDTGYVYVPTGCKSAKNSKSGLCNRCLVLNTEGGVTSPWCAENLFSQFLPHKQWYNNMWKTTMSLRKVQKTGTIEGTWILPST